MQVDVSELRDAVDGQDHVHLALGRVQLAGDDADVAERGVGEPAARRRVALGLRQAADAVAEPAALLLPGQRCEGLAEPAQNAVERQQGAAPELDDDGGFLRRGQPGTVRHPRSHSGIICAGAIARRSSDSGRKWRRGTGSTLPPLGVRPELAASCGRCGADCSHGHHRADG